MERLKEHFSDYWPIYTGCIIGLSLITWLIVYEYFYPCVSGHYELMTHIMMNADGTSYPYVSNDWVCDCRTVRDSIK